MLRADGLGQVLLVNRCVIGGLHSIAAAVFRRIQCLIRTFQKTLEGDFAGNTCGDADTHCYGQYLTGYLRMCLFPKN